MSISRVVVRFILVVSVTIFLHWSLINSYVYFCAPPTIIGLFKTFLSLGSPVCHTLNMIQFELAKHYVTIWTGAGIAAVAWGVKLLTNNSQNTTNIS